MSDEKRRQRREYHKAWREKNAEHCRAYRKRLRGHRGAAHRLARYGVTQEAFDAMVVSQSGACAICGSVPDGAGKLAVLHVDHCHDTGRVRGLLCHWCNTGLGSFRDRPELLARAAGYLAR